MATPDQVIKRHSYYNFPRDIAEGINIFPHPEKIPVTLGKHSIAYYHRNFAREPHNAHHIDHLRQFDSSLGFLELPPEDAPVNPTGHLFTPQLFSSTPTIHVRQLLPMTSTSRTGPRTPHPKKVVDMGGFALQYDYSGTRTSAGVVLTPKYAITYGAYHLADTLSLGLAVPFSYTSPKPMQKGGAAGAAAAAATTPPTTPVQFGMQYDNNRLAASLTLSVPDLALEAYAREHASMATTTGKVKLTPDGRMELGVALEQDLDAISVVEATALVTVATQTDYALDTGVYYRHKFEPAGEMGVGCHYNSHTNSFGLLFTWQTSVMKAIRAVNNHRKVKKAVNEYNAWDAHQ